MVILRGGPRGLEVLLGERTKREGDPWSGQIGLPGGRHRDEDPTMLATALRETKEEVGIDLEGRAEILGHMPPRAPGNKPEVLVVPYVALATEPIEATPGPEMASVFWVPLVALPATHGTSTVATPSRETAFEARTDKCAASTALRRAAAETTSFSAGLGVRSIRWWASSPAAVRLSRGWPHSGHRRDPDRIRVGRIPAAMMSMRRNR